MVARGASARLRLVGHLGWVHQHEACPVGQPRELMCPTERRGCPAEIGAGLVGKRRGTKGGVEPRYPRHWACSTHVACSSVLHNAAALLVPLWVLIERSRSERILSDRTFLQILHLSPHN